MSQLVTGEAVVLQVRLARMPTRALAVTLDVLLQAVVLGMLISILVGFLSEVSEALAAATVIISVVLVMIGYRLVMETLTRGQTLGKMALGLRVVRDDGSAIRFRQALVRTLLWLFVDFAPWFACCPGIVSSLTNKQGKRIGDMLAGTVVIRERHQPAASPVLFVPGPLVAWAGSLELSRLTDDLANTAREYLARYTELEPTAREALGNALAYRFGDVTAPAPPAPMTPPAFLSAVLAERRRRELNRLATTRPTGGGVYAAHAPGTYGPAGPFAPRPTYGAGQPSPYGPPSPAPYGQPVQPTPYGAPAPGSPYSAAAPGSPYGAAAPGSPYGAPEGPYGTAGPSSPSGQPSPGGSFASNGPGPYPSPGPGSPYPPGSPSPQHGTGPHPPQGPAPEPQFGAGSNGYAPPDPAQPERPAAPDVPASGGWTPPA